MWQRQRPLDTNHSMDDDDVDTTMDEAVFDDDVDRRFGVNGGNVVQRVMMCDWIAIYWRRCTVR